MFIFFKTSRPALGPTQPPVHSVPWFYPGGVQRQGVKLYILLHLVPRLRMRGAASAPSLCLYDVNKKILHLHFYFFFNFT